MKLAPVTMALIAATLVLFGPRDGKAQAPGNASPAPPVPRLPDGHPDLNGTWDNGSGIDFVQPQRAANGSVCIAGCPPANAAPAAARPAAPPFDLPKYRPEFQGKVHDLDQRQVQT